MSHTQTKDLHPPTPKNFAHRVFKIFKATGMDFRKTVKLVKSQYFKDQPREVAQKIVAQQLRSVPYNIQIEDDGTYIREDDPNSDIDLMETFRSIKGEKKMPKSDDELQDDALEVASSLKEFKQFEKKYPESAISVGKLKPKRAKPYGKKNLWIVEIEELGAEKLTVIVDPVAQQAIEVKITELEEDEAVQESVEDLKKLKGMTPKIQEPLEELGIFSIKELAEAEVDTEDLEEVGIDSDIFDEWVVRAQEFGKKGSKKKAPAKKKPKPPKKKPKAISDPPTPPKISDPPKPPKVKSPKLPKVKEPPQTQVELTPKITTPEPKTTPKPVTTPEPPSVEDILDKGEQEVYSNILSVDLGPNGMERSSNLFGQRLASMVTGADQGKQLSILNGDVPVQHTSPPPPSTPLPQPQRPKVSPQPAPEAKPARAPPESKEPPEVTARAHLFRHITQTTTSTAYPRVLYALKRKFIKLPPVH